MVLGGEHCWMINWRELFRGGLGDHGLGGQMRAFHVVFRLRILRSGTLALWDDDGCVIRQNGRLVHDDRSAHMLTRTELRVRRGDTLEVAQWQSYGGWLWGGRVVSTQEREDWLGDDLSRYAEAVELRLKSPEGPALKLYTNGAEPLRAATAVYSLILNGYTPSRVILYGEHQWSPQTRGYLKEALPFATVVPTEALLSLIAAAGGPTLARWAGQYWVVLKTCIGLLAEPSEFCLIDDDLCILDSVTDALEAFRSADLVFAPDIDHGDGYLAAWGRVFAISAPLRTATFNAGLYWCRQVHDPRWLARMMLQNSPYLRSGFVWEQGFIAAAYAGRTVHALPGQRYFYPLFDGLPGGVLGYDYHRNPCGFASLHFGGLSQKPTDAVVRQILPDLLSRRTLGPAGRGRQRAVAAGGR